MTHSNKIELEERIKRFNLWYAQSDKMYAYKATAAYTLLLFAKKTNQIDLVPDVVFKFYDKELNKVYNILDDYKETSEIVEEILNSYARQSDDRQHLTQLIEKLILSIKK